MLAATLLDTMLFSSYIRDNRGPVVFSLPYQMQIFKIQDCCGESVTHHQPLRAVHPAIAIIRQQGTTSFQLLKNCFFGEISPAKVSSDRFLCWKKNKMINPAGYKIRNQEAIHFLTLTVVECLPAGRLRRGQMFLPGKRIEIFCWTVFAFARKTKACFCIVGA